MTDLEKELVQIVLWCIRRLPNNIYKNAAGRDLTKTLEKHKKIRVKEALR